MTKLFTAASIGAGFGTLLLAAGLTASAQNATIHPDAHIYGWNGYATTSEETKEQGWYMFGTKGEENQLWHDEFLQHMGTLFNVGYIRDGKICGYFGNSTAMFYLEFDMVKGGAPLQEPQEMPVEGEHAINRLWSGAYNAADDCVYGFATSQDLSKFYLVKASAEDPTNINIVREIPEGYGMMVSCCFSPKDNMMYGVDVYGDLVRCDVHGNFELLGLGKDLDYGGTPAMGGWESGMTYSPKDDAFIWNRQFADYTSHLVKIDANTYKWSKIADIALWHQYTFLDTTDHDGSDNGPARGKCVAFNFEGVSTDGSVVYTMPAKLADGTDAPASMTWTASCGDITKTGTAAPGETVTVEYTGLTEGNAVFKFRADNGDAKGITLVSTKWIGNDDPMPPTNVTLSSLPNGKYKLTWTAPERGAHFGYLDKSKLVYAAFLDGEQVKTPVAECEMEVELPMDGDTKGYRFMVVAVANGRQSEGAYSNTMFAGHGYKLPYTIAPTESDMDRMTVINVDNDKSRWNYLDEIGENHGCFFTSRDWDNPGDDWLITPPFYMEKALTYQITFQTRIHRFQKTEEYYDIWLGNAATVEGIRGTEVVGKTKVDGQEYKTVTYSFSPAEDGTHYLGLHYIGDADQGGIYVRNITVSAGQEGGIAGVSTDESVKVWGGNGEIAVSSPKSVKVDVFTPDGRAAARQTVQGNDAIPVAAGIYIVCVDGKSFKVNVR